MLGRAAAGDVVNVRSLLERGANAATRDDGGWSPLHSAASAGRSEVIEELIRSGVSLDDGAGSSGTTAIILAASKGHQVIVSSLLAASANAQATDRSGSTALHRAAGNDHVAIIDVLLAACPAALDARDADGQTPFHVAAIHQKEAACLALAEAGAQLDTVSTEGEAPAQLLKPSLRLRLGMASEDEEAADHTDWLAAHFPVFNPPR